VLIYVLLFAMDKKNKASYKIFFHIDVHIESYSRVKVFNKCNGSQIYKPLKQFIRYTSISQSIYMYR